jgi:ATP-dependent Lhr-like helicase
VERRRVLAELLLERYGIVTREQVLAEGVRGGFSALYDTFSNLETLGVCRRGYFIEGMGGAQFALPGAVERLRAARPTGGPSAPSGARGREPRALVLAAADPAQPYGAALPWPRRRPRPPGESGESGGASSPGASSASSGGRPARVAGAYVVLLDDLPALYVERGGRGLLTLAQEAPDRSPGAVEAVGETLRDALVALADAVRSGRMGKLALERIDGQPAIASNLAQTLIELGFHPGPRRLTLSA